MATTDHEFNIRVTGYATSTLDSIEEQAAMAEESGDDAAEAYRALANAYAGDGEEGLLSFGRADVDKIRAGLLELENSEDALAEELSKTGGDKEGAKMARAARASLQKLLEKIPPTPKASLPDAARDTVARMESVKFTTVRRGIRLSVVALDGRTILRLVMESTARLLADLPIANVAEADQVLVKALAIIEQVMGAETSAAPPVAVQAPATAAPVPSVDADIATLRGLYLGLDDGRVVNKAWLPISALFGPGRRTWTKEHRAAMEALGDRLTYQAPPGRSDIKTGWAHPGKTKAMLDALFASDAFEVNERNSGGAVLSYKRVRRAEPAAVKAPVAPAPAAVEAPAVRVAGLRETFTVTGMQSNVWDSTTGGYNVTLKDLDSGETLPTSFHFDDLDKAIAKAKEILGPEPKSATVWEVRHISGPGWQGWGVFARGATEPAKRFLSHDGRRKADEDAALRNHNETVAESYVEAVTSEDSSGFSDLGPALEPLPAVPTSDAALDIEKEIASVYGDRFGNEHQGPHAGYNAEGVGYLDLPSPEASLRIFLREAGFVYNRSAKWYDAPDTAEIHAMLARLGAKRPTSEEVASHRNGNEARATAFAESYAQNMKDRAALAETGLAAARDRAVKAARENKPLSEAGSFALAQLQAHRGGGSGVTAGYAGNGVATIQLYEPSPKLRAVFKDIGFSYDPSSKGLSGGSVYDAAPGSVAEDVVRALAGPIGGAGEPAPADEPAPETVLAVEPVILPSDVAPNKEKASALLARLRDGLRVLAENSA